MTPGPTQVLENVRMARSLECTNPDIDASFYEFYKETCEEISHLLGTKNETLILSGEGILGLEAACASITEPEDQVLVLDNGIYGRGFADFVSMYGGKPYIYSVNEKNAIDVTKLEDFLQDNHDFKYATVVHCDTPSGVLNDIAKICPLLKKYGIMTVVDSVSAMFGEPVNVDESKIDLLCGGSQKVISAPPGLTFVVVSDTAKQAMKHRNHPIASFYANLMIFDGYYEKKWFPYTMPISDIYGLRAAIDNIKADHKILKRHEIIGNATRDAIKRAGLKLHLDSGYSNTVTVFDVPDGISAQDILDTMKKDYQIMLAGSFGELEGKVIRIGHMGANATMINVQETLHALSNVLTKLGYQLKDTIKIAPEFLFEYEMVRNDSKC